MTINLIEAVEALARQLPTGWRTGSSPTNPLHVVKQNPPGKHPKWEDMGGVAAGELDVILRTSANVEQAATRILERILHPNKAAEDAASQQAQVSAFHQEAISRQIREEVARAMVEVKAALVSAVERQNGTVNTPAALPEEPEEPEWAPEPEQPGDVHAPETYVPPVKKVRPTLDSKRGRPRKTEAAKLRELEDWKIRCAQMEIALPKLDKDGFMRPDVLSRLRKRYKLWTDENQKKYEPQFDALAKEAREVLAEDGIVPPEA